MKLYDEFEDRHDDFEILAFHDAKVKDVADLEEKIETLKRDVWGRDLPFPVLIDRTGETLRKFGISSFPTIIVIGPDGNVVKWGGEHTVREYLMETDRLVARLRRKLNKARTSRKLDKAIEEVIAEGGERAAFALRRFGEKKARKKYIPKVLDALNELGGEYAISFFAGHRGLGSKSKKIRLAAAKALKEHCQNKHLSLLINKINAEEDPDVKEVLSEAAKAVSGRH